MGEYAGGATTYYERTEVVVPMGSRAKLGTLEAQAPQPQRLTTAHAQVFLVYSVQVGTAAVLLIDSGRGRPIVGQCEDVAALLMKEFLVRHQVALADVRWLLRTHEGVWIRLMLRAADQLGGTERVLFEHTGPVGGAGTLSAACIAMSDHGIALSPTFRAMLELAVQEDGPRKPA